GVVLYEMATGILPFRGESSGVIYESILSRTPVRASQVNRDLPLELDKIIEKALEKDRELRYQHASEMRTDLKRLKRDRDSRRSGARIETGAPSGSEDDLRAGEAFASPREASASRGSAPLAASPVTPSHEGSSDTAIVVGLLARHKRGLLAAAALIGVFIAVAGYYLLWQPRPAMTRYFKERQLTTNPAGNAVIAGAISPDGKYLAYSDTKGVHLKLIETGEEKSLPIPEALKNTTWAVPSWFPDGTRFLADTSPASTR